MVNECIGYIENKFKIMRKSIYHRKYHIQNAIFDIGTRYNMHILTNDKNKISEIFEKIECVTSD